MGSGKIAVDPAALSASAEAINRVSGEMAALAGFGRAAANGAAGALGYPDAAAAADKLSSELAQTFTMLSRGIRSVAVTLEAGARGFTATDTKAGVTFTPRAGK